jgi:hypothetical protein
MDAIDSFGKCTFCGNIISPHWWYNHMFCENCWSKYQERMYEKGKQAILKEIEIIKQEEKHD